MTEEFVPASEFKLDSDLDPVKLLTINPDGAPIFELIFGRKGSGKSHYMRSYARSWPYEALLIDPTRDLDPDGEFTRPWPGGDHWPEPDDPDDEDVPKHRRFRMVPNRRAAGHREAVDQAILLAHDNPEPTFIGIDEGRYLFASDEKILTGSDIVQNEGRHGDDFLFITNPRVIGLRPILRFQADIVVLFDLDGRKDIKEIADAIGMDEDELYDLIANLEKEALGPRGEIVSGFVHIDKPRKLITVFPILP